MGLIVWLNLQNQGICKIKNVKLLSASNVSLFAIKFADGKHGIRNKNPIHIYVAHQEVRPPYCIIYNVHTTKGKAMPVSVTIGVAVVTIFVKS